MTADVSLDGNELIARRDLDAEPTLVWEALTTPEHLAAFWGGRHATVPPESVSVDLRPGGTFELETVGPDGAGRRLRFHYEAVEPPTRLVFTEPRSGITTEIRLQPIARGTTLVVHQRRLPPELQTEQARTGLAGILDQLESLLRTMATNERRADT